MINRQNYHWIKAYLEHLQTVMQINARSLERYWSYLRHALLWADETSFAEATHIRPPFAAYLAEVRPADADEPLAPATLKKIFQVTQRFFRWAKLTFPRNFQAISAAAAFRAAALTVLYLYLAGLHIHVADQQRAQLRGAQARVQRWIGLASWQNSHAFSKASTSCWVNGSTGASSQCGAGADRLGWVRPNSVLAQRKKADSATQ